MLTLLFLPKFPYQLQASLVGAYTHIAMCLCVSNCLVPLISLAELRCYQHRLSCIACMPSATQMAAARLCSG